jgi:aspartate/methionine/tyrosine aminotransferase
MNIFTGTPAITGFNSSSMARAPCGVVQIFQLGLFLIYIWCTRGEDSWKSVEALAQLGILVTPGIFYGAVGSQHVRIAMTASDDAIADAAARINASKAQ